MLNRVKRRRIDLIGDLFLRQRIMIHDYEESIKTNCILKKSYLIRFIILNSMIAVLCSKQGA